MFARLAAHLPSALTNLPARVRRAIGIAIVIPLVLIGVLGSVQRSARPDSGLAGCALLSSTRHLTAADFPKMRVLFAGSRWPDLRTAGTDYADLLTRLRTARGTDGYEAVWFYERLLAACAGHDWR